LRHEDAILIGIYAIFPGRQLRTFRRNYPLSNCVHLLTNEQDEIFKGHGFSTAMIFERY